MRSLLGLGALTLAMAAYAATTKVTVQQLDAVLAEMHSQSKSDDQVANKLKETELTEQLLPSVMNSFAQYQPGPENCSPDPGVSPRERAASASAVRPTCSSCSRP